MIMASGAFHGQSQEGCSKSVDAIGNVFDTKFFGNRAAFDLLLVQAREGGGDAGLSGGFWKEIARNLLKDELVEGFIGGKGVNDVVAIGPDTTV